MKSKDWVFRQNRDFFVKKAKYEGYVSRAAYKLIEIDKKFNLIHSSNNILELGSSPGGWSQVVCETNKKAKVYALDLIDMKYQHQNLIFLKEDFLNFNFSSILKKFDLILSDVAPNTSGHQATDHLKISTMIEEIIYILDKIAMPNSSLVFKIWKGIEEINIIKSLKKKYSQVSYFKPKSSRSESSEIFIVANKFIT